jgi:hypothetical protein
VESSLQVTNEVIPGIVSQLLSISDWMQSVETEAGRARLLLQALAPALEYVCELVGLGYNVTLCSVNSL